MKWPKFWSACNKRLEAGAERRAGALQIFLTPKNTEGVGENILVSPTPSVVIGTGALQNNRIALVALQRNPARMTQSSK